MSLRRICPVACVKNGWPIRFGSIATLCLGICVALAIAAAQRTYSGRVVNNNGAPQPGCQVEFFWDHHPNPTYSPQTNNEGYYFLTNPRPGNYSVTVRRGQQWQRINDVTIGDYGIDPKNFVVNW